MRENVPLREAGGVDEALPEELEDRRRQLEAVNTDARDLIAGLTDAQFNWRPAPDQWSIAECLDHLTVTNRELIRPLGAGIMDARAKGWLGRGPFRHGWLIGKFIRSMEPPVKRRFKAPRIFKPRSAMPLEEVAREFFETQGEVLRLINEANGVNLARVKITSPVTSWVKYSLGQAFDLIATHERRHLWQAREVKGHAAFPRAEA
jgi:hypothetical protein